MLLHAPPFICKHLFFRRIAWANGDVYVGEVKGGKTNGKGKITWADGDVYEGEWKDGKRTGKGKYTWADGDVYEGEFKDGKITDAKATPFP